MDISDIGKHWIDWMITQQDADGLFARYCFNDGKNKYEPCAAADADDAMMAMWVELLYRLAPRGGLPERWKVSAEKALYQLDSIYNPKLTVFSISKSLSTGLLIDNIEIYAAFKRIEREAVRMGDSKTVIAFHTRAEHLKMGITAAFWDKKTSRFKASTQARDKEEFYPDMVAQLLPMLYGFSSASVQRSPHYYKSWMKAHRDEWFSLIGTNYPWGLLAILAANQGDTQTANCWMQKATAFRNGNQWDVLDEAAYQVVEKKLQKKWPEGAPACAPKEAS
jgi:hypothetical protein